MNRCYKIIFNRRLRIWQVASELTRGQGKSQAVCSRNAHATISTPRHSCGHILSCGALSLLFLAPSAFATTYTATDSASLSNALSSAGNGDTIQITNSITLTSTLPPITQNITIQGNGHTLDGGNTYRGLFVQQGTVAVSNLVISDTVAKGGNGGGNGGGGMGAGGALFVNTGAAVTLLNVQLQGNQAVGGNVSNVHTGDDGGGGGGMEGNGGKSSTTTAPTGGLGGGGGNGGTTGFPGAAGGGANSGGTGNPNGGSGGTFGGGGGGLNTGTGGNGGDFAGGGGGGQNCGSGGNGGFGGGGGGGGCGSPGSSGGMGGFGGGGGGGGSGALAGFGGGNGGAGQSGIGGGGGGAGFGGAVFVRNGGSLTIVGTSVIDDNTVTGGNGGQGTLGGAAGGNGIAAGSAMFLQGNGNVTYTPATGQTVTLDTSTIADQTALSGSGGSWGLVKTGAGTLQLTGTAGFSGTVQINEGIVATGSDASLGASNALGFNGGTLQSLANLNTARSITLNADGGTFDTQGFATVLSGSITGTGSLTKKGTETLALTGINTYTGSTNISAGRLQLGRGDALSNTTAVTVDNGASFDINGYNVTIGSLAGAGNVLLASGSLRSGGDNNSTTFSGVINGIGGLTKQGTGMLTLTGTNTYSGGTTISAGTLQIGDGGTTGSITGNMTNNADLIFNRSDALVYNGNMSGTGTLTKQSSGTLTLNGTNTYSGDTTVSLGTLLVNGSIASATSVLNGGTLGGSGTVGSVNVESGGTLAPGNSIGTLTIQGNLSFASGSIYRVETDANGNSDRVNVSGTALLNGGVMALPATGNYSISTRYTILNAGGGFNGTTFSGVSSDLAFLTPTLSYDTSNVYLRLSRNDIAYADVARTRNQRATATALQLAAGDAAGDMSTALDAVNNLSAAQAPAAYDRIGGAGLVALRRAGASFSTGLGNQVQARLNAVGVAASAQSVNGMQLAANDRIGDLMPQLAQAGSGKFTLAGGIPVENTQHGFWLRGYGTDQNTDSDGNAAGTRIKEAGISAGFDMRVRDDLVVGAALSHGNADVRTTLEETGKSRGNAAAIYASYANGPWSVNGNLTLAHNTNNMQRRIQVGALDRTANSRFDSRTVAAYGELTYDLPQATWTLQPLAGLALTYSKADGFTETGAGALNLQAEAQGTTSTKTLFGAKALFNLSGISLQPRAIWSHEFGDINKGMSVQLQGSPAATFTTYGVDLPRNALIAGLTIAGKPSERLALFADIQGEFNSKQTNLGLLVGLRASW